MLTQSYIESSKNKNILYVINNLEKKYARGIVVLIPGFSQSKSDIDYFMTRLSNKLHKKGFITVQLDLYGHGDSYGSLENFSWNDFLVNVEDVHKNLSKTYGELSFYLITRGVYGNIAMSTSLKEKYNLLCINPINNIDEIWIGIKEKGIVDIGSLLSQNIRYKYLFMLMGSEITNLLTQSINLDLLTSLFLYSNYIEDHICWSEDFSKDSLEIQAKKCFVREPMWQEIVLDKVVERMEEKHSINAYEK